MMEFHNMFVRMVCHQQVEMHCSSLDVGFVRVSSRNKKLGHVLASVFPTWRLYVARRARHGAHRHSSPHARDADKLHHVSFCFRRLQTFKDSLALASAEFLVAFPVTFLAYLATIDPQLTWATMRV
eukprot:TRINITY_DN85485_c0_g1_i1.p1 TRINITY_DN85485_c0_g1~~TRINITY_DN85485_c0_g1_i1.p1  ORF type:complete len:126 (+),score=6.52 TRINITY_DN85485_c0_g1_i1:108-485(+)